MDKPKAETVKPVTPAGTPKPAAKTDKKKDACSDPLDCQY
jgi:hypothetical protein